MGLRSRLDGRNVRLAAIVAISIGVGIWVMWLGLGLLPNWLGWLLLIVGLLKVCLWVLFSVKFVRYSRAHQRE